MKPINLTDDEVQKLKRGELAEIVRKVSPQPEYFGNCNKWMWHAPGGKMSFAWTGLMSRKMPASRIGLHCPYARPNETRWVREVYWTHEADKLLVYRADGEMPHHMSGTKWRSAFQMPQWASRFMLKVTAVNVENRGDWVWVMKVEEDKGV